MEITLQKINLYDILNDKDVLLEHWKQADGMLIFNEQRKRKYVIIKAETITEGEIGFYLGNDYVKCKEHG